MATEVAVKKQVELSAKDCEYLAAMLDVHVRPIYFKAAKPGSPNPEFGAERLAECDRFADLFWEAAGIKPRLERTPAPATPEVDHDC